MSEEQTAKCRFMNADAPDDPKCDCPGCTGKRAARAQKDARRRERAIEQAKDLLGQAGYTIIPPVDTAKFEPISGDIIPYNCDAIHYGDTSYCTDIEDPWGYAFRQAVAQGDEISNPYEIGDCGFDEFIGTDYEQLSDGYEAGQDMIDAVRGGKLTKSGKWSGVYELEYTEE